MDGGAERPGSLRHGIEAAGMPGAAFHEAARGEGQADEEAVLRQRLAGVMRTGRSKPAAAGRGDDDEGGRKRLLVEPDQGAAGAGGKGEKKPQK